MANKKFGELNEQIYKFYRLNLLILNPLSSLCVLNSYLKQAKVLPYTFN